MSRFLPGFLLAGCVLLFASGLVLPARCQSNRLLGVSAGMNLPERDKTSQTANAPRVRLEARFDRPEALQDWSANGDMVDLAIAGGVMQFRGSGPDPVFEYRPRLNIVASPYQAIEIRLKSDRDGTFEVFWSNTTEGRYGGFSGEKRTPFAVRGDGQWHTYRVFPFWQKEGRIVRLRLDPYDGTQFALSSVRIVEYAASTTPVAPTFAFDLGSSGWQALHGATLQRTGGSLAMALTSPDGFVLSPRIAAETPRFPVVALRLASTAHRATLVFATADSYGLHSLPFDLRPDGRPHLYNLDMRDAPGWQGRLIAIGLRPGEGVGETCRLYDLRLAERPQGPPEIRALWFGVEDALPRAGSPVTLRARLMNSGGEPARGLRVSVALPKGARLIGMGNRSSGALRFGQETELRWRAVFPRPGTARITLRAAGGNALPITVQAVEQITARPVVSKASYVPRPQPVKGRYPVGVYYFPGWKSASQWAPITRYPERRPVLGWYREGDPQTADWQIKWAVEHGITFFAYDWYWSQGARQLEQGLNAYLQSRYRKYLQFCLLWANHNPPKSSSRADRTATLSAGAQARVIHQEIPPCAPCHSLCVENARTLA